VSNTLQSAEATTRKSAVSAVFDRVCQDYDHPALRFFPFTAERMVTQLQPRSGWKVLDVATGTGALAVALAQAVGEGGRVMGIDLSEGMLTGAEHNIQKMAITNVDLFQMDAEEPEFRSNYFHAVTCSFGLFFLPDMARALAQWARVTGPGGTILFSSFTENAFAPLGACFVEDLEAAGVDVSARPLASERLKDATVCHDLLQAAGLHNIRQEVVQMGYHLRDANDWWQVVWGSAMRGLVELVDEAQRETFRQRHLERVTQLTTDKGLWMDVEVRFNSAQVAER
jgi:ubiquinone/menaquinone biosynthesis C-methylase UbiE